MPAHARRCSPARSSLSIAVTVVALAALIPAYRAHAGAATNDPFAGWTTAFRDDFNGSAGSRLDGDWLYDVGTSYPGGAPTWGTGEIETSTDSTANVRQDGSGHLLITPLRGANGQWT